MSETLLKELWRCLVTGNPVGTDTQVLGIPCNCQVCRLSAKVKELTEALRPFADAAKTTDGLRDDWPLADVDPNLTTGDLRKARSVYDSAISQPERKIQGE